MPRYDYACHACEKKQQAKLKRDLTSEEYDEMVLFETSHMMNPTEEELREASKCPRCGSNNCTKSLKNSNVTSYILGNGFLDVAGAKRDMNLYKLTQEDPYANYRAPGEVDHIKSNLSKGGKYDPKTKYFTAKDNKSKKKKDKKK